MYSKISLFHDISKEEIFPNKLSPSSKFLKQYYKELTPKASYSLKECVIVSAKWRKSLLRWIKKIFARKPEKFEKSIQDLLSSDGSLQQDLILHRDYEVVSRFIFDNLQNLFGSAPSVLCGFGLDPSTNKEKIYFDRVSLIIRFLKKNSVFSEYKFGASLSWTVSDLVMQFCKLKNIDPKNYSLYSQSNIKYENSQKLRNIINNSKIVTKFIMVKIPSKIKTSKSFSIDLSTSHIPKRKSLKEDLSDHEASRPLFLSSIDKQKKKEKLTLNNKKSIPKNESFECSYDISESPCNISEKSQNSSSTRSASTCKEKTVIFDDKTIFSKPLASTKGKIGMSKAVSSSELSLQGISKGHIKPVGLNNIGNTCYFNSVIQCVARLPPLALLFLSRKYENYIISNNNLGTGGKICHSFFDLLDDLAISKESSISPKSFWKTFVKKYDQFNSFDEEDAHEFLLCLIDGLHEDMNSKSSNPKKTIKDPFESFMYYNNSPIYDLLKGKTTTMVKCSNCGFTKSIGEAFIVFLLSLPQKSYKNTTKLEDCLKKHFSEETIDDIDISKCEKCEKKVPIVKNAKIEIMSDFFIICLKRFSEYEGQLMKNDIAVEYPSKLKLSVFSSLNYQYKLIGCVYHHGTLDGGHYTSAALDQYKNKWFNFNDSRVTQINEQNVHKKSAYILFYQKI